jgi:MATE family multidrug resistance protein
MFAMGLSVAVTIRVGEPERTDGLCEIAACGAIYIFIGNTSWDCICSYFCSFHQYLPQLFVNVNDMTHIVETKLLK